MTKRFSICIPAFNRPEELSDLLESIASEPPGDWEIVVSEDSSPKRKEITEVVQQFAQAHELLNVRLLTTPANLGYDRNLRYLADHAEGRYCVFMGDDDLWCAGTLQQLTRVTDANPGLGVILRAWQTISKDFGKVLDVHRYFPSDRTFDPGPETVAAFFRRSIFISGLAVRTDAARAIRTERVRWDFALSTPLSRQHSHDHAGVLSVADDRDPPDRRGSLLRVKRERARPIRSAAANPGTFPDFCARPLRDYLEH